MRHALVIFVFAVATLLTATRAEAGTSSSANAWGSVAAGCVPDSTTTANALISSSANFGTVTFASGKSGHILLICPVQSLVADLTNYPTKYLGVRFYDSNNTSSPFCSVSAYLFRTGQQSETGSTVATLSDSSSYTGTHETRATFTHTFAFDGYYYWVEIDLYRPSGTAACNPIAVGALLTGV